LGESERISMVASISKITITKIAKLPSPDNNVFKVVFIAEDTQ
jgi:hypothetical protein